MKKGDGAFRKTNGLRSLISVSVDSTTPPLLARPLVVKRAMGDVQEGKSTSRCQSGRRRTRDTIRLCSRLTEDSRANEFGLAAAGEVALKAFLGAIPQKVTACRAGQITFSSERRRRRWSFKAVFMLKLMFYARRVIMHKLRIRPAMLASVT